MLERCIKPITEEIEKEYKVEGLGEEFTLSRDGMHYLVDNMCSSAGCEYRCLINARLQDGILIYLEKVETGTCRHETPFIDSIKTEEQ